MLDDPSHQGTRGTKGGGGGGGVRAWNEVKYAPHKILKTVKGFVGINFSPVKSDKFFVR